ncbi:MAG: DUF5606 domain-containing protein [Bacteroidales bacterium]|jgi:hypothetical protein|nr:DUF5606 domain-containing protein [Bacteroidales bacterium]
MKTKLKDIVTISGQPGLFTYLTQTPKGPIVEAFATKKRNCTGLQAKITSLSDVSIYTSEGEAKLREVFDGMTKVLAGAEAPSGKSNASVLKEFFEKVLPDYDRDKFYVSHMKKVVDWYNLLKKYASVDFEDEKTEEDGEAKSEDGEEAADKKKD